MNDLNVQLDNLILQQDLDGFVVETYNRFYLHFIPNRTGMVARLLTNNPDISTELVYLAFATSDDTSSINLYAMNRREFVKKAGLTAAKLSITLAKNGVRSRSYELSNHVVVLVMFERRATGVRASAIPHRQSGLTGSMKGISCITC